MKHNDENMARAFVHLHVQTEYSGKVRIHMIEKMGDTHQPLLEQVRTLGQEALAVTDCGSLQGAVMFNLAAREVGINGILGTQVMVLACPPNRGANPLILLAKNDAGYRNLCQLLSRSIGGDTSGKAFIDKTVLHEYAEGLIAISGGRGSSIARHLEDQDDASMLMAKLAAEELAMIFGKGNFYLELSRTGDALQEQRNTALLAMSREMGIPVVATDSGEYPGMPMTNPAQTEHFNHGVQLRSTEEMCKLFADIPEAVENTVRIAQRCSVSLIPPELQGKAFLPWNGDDADRTLRQRCMEALPDCYPDTDDEARKRLEEELSAIEQQYTAGNYLFIADLTAQARAQGILLGPGSGKAAASIVNYLLRITQIDPLLHGLMSECFLYAQEPHHITCAPGGDEQLIAWMRKAYGEECVAAVARYPFYKMNIAGECIAGDICPHANAVVIQNRPLAESIPVIRHVYSNRRGVRRVTHYDYETLRLLGEPIMQVFTLDALHKVDACISRIAKAYGITPALDCITDNDKKTLEVFTNGNLGGVFNCSLKRAQQWLPRAGVNSRYDVAAVYALACGGSDELLEIYARRQNLSDVEIMKQSETPYGLETTLAETRGIIVWHEQVLRIVQCAAGYGKGESIILLKALRGFAGSQTHDLLSELSRRGKTYQDGVFAEQVEWLLQHRDEVRRTRSKAHTITNAILTWKTAYLKAHYPAEFEEVYIGKEE